MSEVGGAGSLIRNVRQLCIIAYEDSKTSRNYSPLYPHGCRDTGRFDSGSTERPFRGIVDSVLSGLLRSRHARLRSRHVEDEEVERLYIRVLGCTGHCRWDCNAWDVQLDRFSRSRCCRRSVVLLYLWSGWRTCRTMRCTEWRPRGASWQFERRRWAAIGELRRSAS